MCGCSQKREKFLLGNQSSHVAALPVLHRLENELNGNMDALSNSKLEKLLRWKGIPMSKMGKHAKWKVLYWQIVDESRDINGPRQTWTNADEEKLKLLKTFPSKWETPLTHDLRPRRRETSCGPTER